MAWWRGSYNEERSHRALGGQTPAEVAASTDAVDKTMGAGQFVEFRRRLMPKLGLSCLVFLGIWGALEGGLRLADSLGLAYLIAHHQMNRFAYEADPNPRIGWRFARSRETSFSAVFSARFNSLGLRGAEPVGCKGGEREVWILGDSATFGFGVSEQDTFAAQVERALSAIRHTRVLNAGVMGYNTIQEETLSSALERELGRLPDAIVIHPLFNDTNEYDHLPSSEQMKGYLTGDQGSWEKRVLHAAYSASPYLTACCSQLGRWGRIEAYKPQEIACTGENLGLGNGNRKAFLSPFPQVGPTISLD